MTIRLSYPRIASGLAAGAIAGLFLSGVAWAFTSSAFRYATPQTGNAGIHAAALSPQIHTNVFAIDYDANSLNSSSGCYQTGLALPDAAKLTKVTVWYESTAVGRLQVRLFRNRHSTGAGDDILDQVSADTSGNRVPWTLLPAGPLATVHNGSFSYGFAVCFFGGGTIFYGARLTYTYRDAGD